MRILSSTYCVVSFTLPISVDLGRAMSVDSTTVLSRACACAMRFRNNITGDNNHSVTHIRVSCHLIAAEVRLSLEAPTCLPLHSCSRCSMDLARQVRQSCSVIAILQWYVWRTEVRLHVDWLPSGYGNPTWIHCTSVRALLVRICTT